LDSIDVSHVYYTIQQLSDEKKRVQKEEYVKMKEDEK